MFISSFADLGDKFFHYKRQTYLFAFPLGIVICFLYIMGSLGNSGIRVYIALAMIAELGVFTVLLLFRPRLTRAIEYILYISFTLDFLLLTQISIYTFLLNGTLGPSELANVLNSLSMWMIVFVLGAYLTTDKSFVRILLAFIFIGMSLMVVNNLWVLSSLGMLKFPFVFCWINAFSCLALATLLFQRMGVLQQSYASTDPLTGLLNRRALYQILTMEMERSVRYAKPLSIVIFDVDHFKSINDTHGHTVGDRVLKSISDLVGREIRQVDYLGRWGGEEFLLILPETDVISAKLLAERICCKIGQSQFENVKHVTASFGVTIFEKRRGLDDILHAADLAMYHAKQNGRNQVFVVQEESD
jgi:diguanylate cyclase (GGDEF)-like protein